MFEFFDSVSSFFEMIWNLISNTVTSFFAMFSVLSSSSQITAVLPAILPSFVAVSVLIVCSIGILKLVLSLLPF